MKEDCLFCKIVAGTIPATIVYETKDVLVFRDIQPRAPVHVLLIPKKHISSMNEIQPEDGQLISSIHFAAVKVAKHLGVKETGYRLVNNCGRDGGQLVFHLHYHLLGGKKLS